MERTWSVAEVVKGWTFERHDPYFHADGGARVGIITVSVVNPKGRRWRGGLIAMAFGMPRWPLWVQRKAAETYGEVARG
jgi:hypothetical protein